MEPQPRPETIPTVLDHEPLVDLAHENPGRKLLCHLALSRTLDVASYHDQPSCWNVHVGADTAWVILPIQKPLVSSNRRQSSGRWISCSGCSRNPTASSQQPVSNPDSSPRSDVRPRPCDAEAATASFWWHKADCIEFTNIFVLGVRLLQTPSQRMNTPKP